MSLGPVRQCSQVGHILHPGPQVPAAELRVASQPHGPLPPQPLPGLSQELQSPSYVTGGCFCPRHRSLPTSSVCLTDSHIWSFPNRTHCSPNLLPLPFPRHLSHVAHPVGPPSPQSPIFLPRPLAPFDPAGHSRWPRPASSHPGGHGRPALTLWPGPIWKRPRPPRSALTSSSCPGGAATHSEALPVLQLARPRGPGRARRRPQLPG